MNRTIKIDPLTRIEGHGKITIHLNEEGIVDKTYFHVTQFRGFEKFVQGRPFREMPSIMARICGICPVSHLNAAAKACDQILGVRIPETAEKLRRILNLAQIIQSHALSFFYLSAPDLLLGMDSDPAKRNLLGVLESNPNIARDGIRLRQFGQQIIESFAGKRIHPSWIVAGGVNAPLVKEKIDKVLAELPDILKLMQRNLDWFKASMIKFREEIRNFGNMQTLFMGLVSSDGELEFYDGKLRFVDPSGRIVADGIDPESYMDVIAEEVEPWTYLKFPYYKPKGYPEGIYRIGPLARLNIVDRCGTPMADQELAEFKGMSRGAVLSSFHYHYARLVEILYSVERLELLLGDPDILSKNVKAEAGVNNYEGIGIVEAPRGTLIDHFRTDEKGIITWANMIIATGNNNLAMNRSVNQVAKYFVKGKSIADGMLNRVEAVIRAYDPCLSCSTHAIGKMPLLVELYAPDGTMLDSVSRNA
jgi:NAD-reducing hydrogenase large subunit